MIIPGSAHPQLAVDLSKLTGLELAPISISKFPNGEKRIYIKANLKNKPAVIVQPFSEPVDEHIIEFCLLLDACYHLKASQIIGVVPWLGYSPQDKLFRKGEPVSVHVIARLIESLHIDHLLIVDIHSQKSLSHFTIPVTHLSAVNLYIDYFRQKNLKDHLAVALDKGAVSRVKQFASALNLPVAQLEKKRNLTTGQVSFKAVSGDVKGKHLISFDDFVSTGSTRVKASKILKRQGALSYTDCITHALLAAGASQKLATSQIDHLLSTDSYPIPKNKRFRKLKILPIAPLLAKSLKSLL